MSSDGESMLARTDDEEEDEQKEPMGKRARLSAMTRGRNRGKHLYHHQKSVHKYEMCIVKIC